MLFLAVSYHLSVNMADRLSLCDHVAGLYIDLCDLSSAFGIIEAISDGSMLPDGLYKSQWFLSAAALLKRQELLLN